MNVDTGEFRALSARVDQLAADLERYAQDSATLRTFEEMALHRLGYPPKPAVTGAARPLRHLRAVDGGES